MVLERVVTYGRLIKFSHTVFALPFALAAVLLAYRSQPIAWSNLFWVLLALVGARSAAMGFNRWADCRWDALNPRTASRPLITGQISRSAVIALVGASSLLFLLSAAMLGRLCLMLAFPVLAVLFGYSYTKRFTAYSHLFLGFAIGLAPVGAWVGMTGNLDPRILLLSLALMSYIAGFDILYACQDVEFDRDTGLFSMPACWGIRLALRVSSILHVGTLFFLALIYHAFALGPLYLALLGVISVLLVIEHRMVKPDRLDQVPFAFFHMNSAVSILLFLAVWLDTWLIG